MALTPEQVTRLLKLDSEKTKGGRKPKGGIDTTVRDYHTWYALNHKMFDEDGPDGRAVCSNPNCPEAASTKAKLVVEVGGVNMCRICFLGGYTPNGN